MLASACLVVTALVPLVFHSLQSIMAIQALKLQRSDPRSTRKFAMLHQTMPKIVCGVQLRLDVSAQGGGRVLVTLAQNDMQVSDSRLNLKNIFTVLAMSTQCTCDNEMPQPRLCFIK